jgi:hypothetical protein
MGISDIVFDIEGQNLRVEANLGGLKKTVWFMCIFIVLLAILFIVTFGLTFKQKEPVLMSILPFTPWPIIVPILYFVMKSRTLKAIDIMLGNIAGVV